MRNEYINFPFYYSVHNTADVDFPARSRGRTSIQKTVRRLVFHSQLLFTRTLNLLRRAIKAIGRMNRLT